MGRLKRYSKVDLKAPLKGTFGRSVTPSPMASRTEQAAPGGASSDYETPIYETKKVSGCVGGFSPYLLLIHHHHQPPQPPPMPATVPCQVTHAPSSAPSLG